MILRIGLKKILNNDDKKFSKKFTINLLIVKVQVEKIKINCYHRKQVILFKYWFL